MAWVVRNVSAAEFVYWQAYAELEPFGGLADDYRAAIGAVLPASAMTGEKYDVGRLFPSLAEPEEVAAERRAKERRRIGRSFRGWATANCPARVAVRPDQTTAK